MRKTYYLFLFAISLGFAQIPNGYYTTATGTGLALKTKLYTIISTNTTDQGYAGLYVTYQNSDKDNYYEIDGTVLDMYSERPTATDPYNFSLGATQRCGNYSAEGDCYNREHIIPQSFFNSNTPMVSDAHFITPTDGKVNGFRSNYPHGMVGTLASSSGISNPTLNGSKLGSGLNSGYSAGYSGTVFEPIDEFKGDIARMYFYFATRYQNLITTWGNSYAMFDGTSGVVFTPTFLEILKRWNILDPVNQREIDRNNAIYLRQNNRNPYIDNNSYVAAVWGNTLSTDDFAELSNVMVYPNPSNGNKINIQTEVQLDAIELINFNGQLMQSIKKPSFQNNIYALENLPKGFYLLKLSTENSTTTKKLIIN